jgi:hypothetical protein
MADKKRPKLSIPDDPFRIVFDLVTDEGAGCPPPLSMPRLDRYEEKLPPSTEYWDPHLYIISQSPPDQIREAMMDCLRRLNCNPIQLGWKIKIRPTSIPGFSVHIMRDQDGNVIIDWRKGWHTDIHTHDDTFYRLIHQISSRLYREGMIYYSPLVQHITKPLQTLPCNLGWEFATNSCRHQKAYLARPNLLVRSRSG